MQASNANRTYFISTHTPLATEAAGREREGLLSLFIYLSLTVLNFKICGCETVLRFHYYFTYCSPPPSKNKNMFFEKGSTIPYTTVYHHVHITSVQ